MTGTIRLNNINIGINILYKRLILREWLYWTEFFPFRYSAIPIFYYPNIQICRFPHYLIFCYPNILISQYSDLPLSLFSDIPLSQYVMVIHAATFLVYLIFPGDRAENRTRGCLTATWRATYELRSHPDINIFIVL